MSVSQLSVLIRTGSVDPVEVTEAVFEAIEDHADKAIFISLFKERALKEARASSARIRDGRSLGVLDGIPVAWKDLFDIAGVVTTAGSRVLAGEPPASDDAAVVKHLRIAGMVAVGRVNMSEFAFSGLGINPHYDTPRNPRSSDVSRIPGGSSSGSGVAVAAGLVPVSIGTDTGGSVRIPAAFNGVVGYKATRGRYSMEGVFPLAESLDSLGPLCRTVGDAIWVDAAMQGLSIANLPAMNCQALEIVVPKNVVFEDIEPGVANAFERAIERLAQAGARIRPIMISAFNEILDLTAHHGALVTAEAYARHRHRLTGPQAAHMDPRVVTRTRFGEKITRNDYLKIIDTRARLIGDISSMISPHVLIAFPTVPHVAPPLEPLKTDDELFVKTNTKTLRNTSIGNFLDWCGISIPCGTGDGDMPVGFLLSGLPGRDGHLLSAALAAEAVIRGREP